MWSDHIPKDFKENLEYRREARTACALNVRGSKAAWEVCRNDILFFLNTFCWLHEPRPRRDEEGRLMPQIVPFITWPHQDPLILKCRELLGFTDVGVEKSRGEGMTWIAIYLALHDWIFARSGEQKVSIGLVSRNEKEVDTPGDLNTLMPKFLWALEHLPRWMVGQPEKDYQYRSSGHTILNMRNGSLISGYSATGEVGSGGRYTWFFLDELSKFPAGDDHDALTSTQGATDSRLIVGTPYGDVGAYHDVMHRASSMEKLYLCWEENPSRNRGLYRMVNETPIAVDPANNPLPENYNPPSLKVKARFKRLKDNGFKLEKRIRSPWYDAQCDRANADPYKIAQELDRDYGGSLQRIFTEQFYASAMEHVRKPSLRVNVQYSSELRPTVTRDSQGALSLWMELDSRNRPPSHPFVVGCDVSTGLGGKYTSNSALEIIDTVTMEQVGELVSNIINPDDFADLAVATCHWLGDAYLAWERNGPGTAFTARVKETGYGNVYLQPKLFDKRRKKKTSSPGWWSDGKSKEVLISEMNRTVAIGELKVHSRELVDESRLYIRIGKAIKHVADARSAPNSPDSGDNHGDRVIGFGVAVQAMRDRPVHIKGQPAEDMVVVPGSIEERDLEHAALMNRATDDWDDRTNLDIMTGRTVGSGY